MFKRELITNCKAFVIWTSILIALFLVVYLVYPSIIENSNIEMINEMMDMFPQDILKAFNMDISSIDSAFGWLKTEGFIFVLLITGVYSATLGASILLKEESEKTIEYLNSMPVKRNKIVSAKVLCGVTYIFLMILCLALFNYIGLSLSGDFDHKLYWLLSVTPLFSSLVIFAICLFISTFARKTQKTFGLSLGITFIFYSMHVISELSGNVQFLKYFTPFTLANLRNVISNISINPTMPILAFVFTTLFISLTYVSYNKKDLI